MLKFELQKILGRPSGKAALVVLAAAILLTTFFACNYLCCLCIFKSKIYLFIRRLVIAPLHIVSYTSLKQYSFLHYYSDKISYLSHFVIFYILSVNIYTSRSCIIKSRYKIYK